MKENKKCEVVLKSCNPAEYGDLVLSCRFIPNDEISEYIASIPEERKFYSEKVAPVLAYPGIEGEEVVTTLFVERDGKKYILSEEKNKVKKRTFTIKGGEEITATDMIVTNMDSPSCERYIVNIEKFFTVLKGYDSDGKPIYVEPSYVLGISGKCFIPVDDARALATVDEDVVIETLWGAKATCLNGSYIVTYSADKSDYNVLERVAKECTYQDVSGPQKVNS